MRSTTPRPVADLIVSAIPDLRDRLAGERLRLAWATIVGADVARRAQPRGLVNGCLTVAVDNSPWFHELTLRRDELLARISEQCGTVRTLRLELGRLVAPPRPTPARRHPTPPLTVEDRREIDAAAAAISDPDLAESARRLMTKAWRVR